MFAIFAAILLVTFFFQATYLSSSIVNNENVYLVFRGLENGIHVQTYNPTTQIWNESIVLPGQTLDTPAVTKCNGELHMVIKGMDGITMWHGYLDLADNAFSGWSILSGTTPSSPVLTSDGTTLSLVVRSNNNSICIRTYSLQTRDWSAWSVISGASTCDSPAAYQIGDVLNLVVRGFSPNDVYINNTLWYSRVDMKTMSDSDWVILPGTFNSSATLAGSKSGGNLTLVAKDPTGSIFINKLYSGSWHDWFLISGSTMSPPAATILGEQLHIVVVGEDGTMWHGIQEQITEEFYAWNILSGYTPSKPALTS